MRAMTVADRIKACVARHPDWTAVRIAKSVGCKSSEVVGKWKLASVSVVATATTKAKGKSLADFKATYDRSYIVPKRIREGLKALRGGWEYEAQFARLAAVSTQDLNMYRDEFAAHIVPLNKDGRRAWAATATLAEQMKGMIR